MDTAKQQLDDLRDIKQMMERSSRFISLSGLSGIAAGVCALVGAYFAYQVINPAGVRIDVERDVPYQQDITHVLHDYMGSRLLTIAVLTFIAAFVLAFMFTYIRSRKHNVAIWGTTARRLMFSVCLPMVAGGIYLLKLVQNGTYGLIAPGCLLFYGLALVNAGKYTISEIKYLGYCEIVLGLVSCWFVGYGLYFWAIGFGILHIVYGAVMWSRYERRPG